MIALDSHRLTIAAPDFVIGRDIPPNAGADSGLGSLLAGTTVLVVEDDLFVGLDLAHMLQDLGATVIGPCRTLVEAEAAAARGGFQIALLDVNLAGTYSFPVAADLRRRGVPVMFVTAHATDDVLFTDETRDITRLAKPVQQGALLRALRQIG